MAQELSQKEAITFLIKKSDGKVAEEDVTQVMNDFHASGHTGSTYGVHELDLLSDVLEHRRSKSYLVYSTQYNPHEHEEGDEGPHLIGLTTDIGKAIEAANQYALSLENEGWWLDDSQLGGFEFLDHRSYVVIMYYGEDDGKERSCITINVEKVIEL